jgi:hypothetical protein
LTISKILAKAALVAAFFLSSAQAQSPDYIRHPASLPCAAGTFVQTLGATSATQATCATIPNAAADGTTKGIAAFTAADFDASSGLISLDYANGQKATTSLPGFLSAADWTTFNGKQAAGNYITALTGNVTASGPGSVAATIAASAVTNAMHANMAAHTLKVNITGSAAAPTDSSLTATLDAELGSTNNYVATRISGVWTAAPLGSVTSAWATALDLDFTAESNQTLSSDTTYTIGGITWTKVNSANDQTSMAVTNGTGLVISPKNNTNTYSGVTRSCPYIYTDIASIIPGYYIDQPLRIWIYISAETNFGTVVADAVGIAVDNLSTSTSTLSMFSGRRSVFVGPVKSIDAARATAAAPTFTANPSALDNTDRVIMLQLPIGIFQSEFALYQGSNSVIWPALSSLIPRARGATAGLALSMTGTVQDIVTGLPAKLVVYGQRASNTATPPTYTIARIRLDYKVQ